MGERKQKEEEAARLADPDGLKNDVVTRNIIEENINANVNPNTLTSTELAEDQEKLSALSEKVKKDQEELNQEQTVVASKEETISKIDDELEKAKKLYEDLMRKYGAEKSKH
mgnify:CR=1 FL=1